MAARMRARSNSAPRHRDELRREAREDLRPGDVVECEIEGIGAMKLKSEFVRKA